MTRWVEGVPLYSYGHSFTMYPAPYNTPYTGEYPERVRQRLGMGRGYFRGRSGTPLQDSVPMMLNDNPLWPANGSSGSREWVLNSRGVVLHQHYMNEAGGGAGMDALYRRGWMNALRTAWALFSSRQFLPATTATKTGATWRQQVTGAEWFKDGCNWFATEAGSTITFNVPAVPHVWLLAAATNPTYASSTLLVNGQQIVTQGQMARYTSVHAGMVRGYNAAAYKVPTGSAGPLTVELLEDKTGFVSGVLVPMVAPPQIFYGLEPTKNPTASGGNLFAESAPYFRTLVDLVAAEFPNVTVVDLDLGWDNARMVGALDTVHRFHPNDLGMSHIADWFCAAISDTITGPDPGVMTL